VLTLLAGCVTRSASKPALDAAVEADAASADAASTDAGVGPVATDAGGADAVVMPAPDASASDANALDAMPFCGELSAIDPFAPVDADITLPRDKGRILSCVHTGSTSAAQLTQSALLTSLGLNADNGYEKFIVQYVSEGPVGTVRRVSAMIYAPDQSAQGLPLVAVNHGTSGMGQPCGPSHEPRALVDVERMIIPVVSQGYAVVATDYQGMGVRGEPLSPYTVGHGEAIAVLDGIRAMQRFHDPRFDASQLSGDIFSMGHSQGGHATLFAHQDFDPSISGRFLGSVSFAPAVGDERLYHYLLGEPLAPTNVAGVVMLMSLYGQAVYYGTALDTMLTPSALQSVPNLLGTDCIWSLNTDIPAAVPTIGQMFTPSFIAAGGACPLNGGPCPSFEPWNTELVGDEPGSFTSASPTLILQGGADTTVPASFTSCIYARIVAHNSGTHDLGCLYATATHQTIIGQSMLDALGWMSAVRSGAPPLLCPKLVPLPAICMPL
jgi:hypothetical protein